MSPEYLNGRVIRRESRQDQDTCGHEQCSRSVIKDEDYCFWHLERKGKNLTSRNTSTGKIKVREAYLVESNLSNLSFSISLPGADLRGADISEAKLRKAELSEADLRGADLPDTDLRGADLSEADLKYTDLSGASTFGASLSGADLRHAGLQNAYLRRTNLSEADLKYADLSGGRFRKADLLKADLREADLSEADLMYANLSEVDLRKADLLEADLRKANLTGADLRRAELVETDLSETDLSGADLGRTVLKHTGFASADVSGTSFADARILEMEEDELVSLLQAVLNSEDSHTRVLGIDLAAEVAQYNIDIAANLTEEYLNILKHNNRLPAKYGAVQILSKIAVEGSRMPEKVDKLLAELLRSDDIPLRRKIADHAVNFLTLDPNQFTRLYSVHIDIIEDRREDEHLRTTAAKTISVLADEKPEYIEREDDWDVIQRIETLKDSPEVNSDQITQAIKLIQDAKKNVTG